MIEVTLAVSDPVYRQAEVLARRSNRPVEEVLRETLEQAFPPFHVHPRRDAMQREEAAFEQMRAELWERFPLHFVAINQGRLIDHDEDQIALVRRLRERAPEADVMLIRQVTATEPPPLRFRSPRFVDEEAIP